MRPDWVKIKNHIYTYCSVCLEIKVLYPCSGVTGGMDPTVKLVATTDVKPIYFPSRSDSHVKRRKKREESDSGGQVFFSVTVYFSPVSLGLQKMKTTAAAQQAESAPDSQHMVPQAETQL